MQYWLLAQSCICIVYREVQGFSIIVKLWHNNCMNHTCEMICFEVNWYAVCNFAELNKEQTDKRWLLLTLPHLSTDLHRARNLELFFPRQQAVCERLSSLILKCWRAGQCFMSSPRHIFLHIRCSACDLSGIGNICACCHTGMKLSTVCRYRGLGGG